MSAISALSDTTKRTADEEETDNDTSDRKNPALACQSKLPKAKIDPQEYVERISSGMCMSTHLHVYLPFELFDWQLTLDVIL